MTFSTYGRSIDLPGRGRSFVYDTGGDASMPVVVLIHGSPGASECSWDRMIAHLAPTYRVLAMDCRGHGKGLRPKNGFTATPFTVDDCADDLSVLLTTLSVDKAMILGYSMGGAVAQRFVQRHPQQTAGLILCSTAMTFTKDKLQGLLHTTADGRLPRITSTFPDDLATKRGLRQIPTRIIEFLRTNPQAAAQAEVELERFNSSPWLSSLNVPTSVVMTTKDTVVPATDQARMILALKGCTVLKNPSLFGHISLPFAGKRTQRLVGAAIRDVAVRAGLATPQHRHVHQSGHSTLAP